MTALGPPPVAPARQIAFAAAASAAGIGLLAGLTEATGETLVLGSFGATCLLLFTLPMSPVSQPRSIVVGHLASASVGLLAMEVAHSWWSVGAATGVTVAAMMVTRTVHPPAGANPLIVYVLRPDWGFLLLPTLAGAVGLVALGLVLNNLVARERYPVYW